MTAAEYDAISYGIRPYTPPTRTTSVQNQRFMSKDSSKAIRSRIASHRKFKENSNCVLIIYYCKSCQKPFGYNYINAAGNSDKCFDLTDHKNKHHNGHNVDFYIKCKVTNPFTGALIEEFEALRDSDILNDVTLWDKVLQCF